MYIPKFRVHQYNFYFSSAQIKAILKPKKVWMVARPASITTSATDSLPVVVDTSKDTVSEEEAK